MLRDNILDGIIMSKIQGKKDRWLSAKTHFINQIIIFQQ